MAGYRYSKKAYTKPVVEKVARKKINPSKFQQAIFDRILDMIVNRTSTDNLIVKAVAGSGKTTTLVETFHRIMEKHGSGVNVVFLAFNKKASLHIESMLPEGFSASTLHSFGLKTLGKVRVNNYKVLNYLNESLGIVDGRTLTDTQERKANNLKRVKAYFISRIISLCKNNALTPDQLDKAKIAEIVFYYGLEGGEVDSEIADFVISTLEKSNNDMGTVDFDDMLYLPAILGHAPKGYDMVFVDEAQDLNEAQIILLENMKRACPKMKLVFVGDPNQSIYGFRGAGTDSMEIIEKRFGCSSLPLSVCYRCGSAIVAHAKLIVPEIESFDGAVSGSVETFDAPDMVLALAHEIKENLAVLCRMNAPLVPLAYSLIRAGLPVVIIGKDIAEGLCKLIDKVAKSENLSIVNFASALADWSDLECEKYRKANRSDRAEEIEDKEATILAFSEGCSDVDSLKERIREIYKDDTGADKSLVDRSIKLLTMHKSKGLEFPVVGILPSKEIRSEQAWQARQEINLSYVARTRAMERLVYFPVMKGQNNEVAK